MQRLDGIRIGTDADWQITALDSSGAAVVFSGTETLAATVWAGDDQAALFAPTVSFINAAAGTMKLSVGAAQTANLAIGLYRVTVTVTSGGRAFDCFDGLLELDHTAGTATAPTVYCSLDDCLEWAPWLQDLQSELADVTGFAKQRGRARSWLDDMIVTRYKYLSYAPSPGVPGFGSWLMQGWGRDPIPSKWLRDQLDANYLIVRDVIKEVTAKKAIAYVCAAQVGPKRDDNPYKDLARDFHWEADNLIKTVRAEIDLPPQDGYADILVNLGATDLR